MFREEFELILHRAQSTLKVELEMKVGFVVSTYGIPKRLSSKFVLPRQSIFIC
jgi:hypothetical protein